MFEANLSALRKTSPAVAELLQAREGGSGREGGGASLVSTPSGVPTLAVGERGFLHSRYDPRREAEAWAARVASDGVVVVYGFGLGYHVEALLRAKKDLRVVAIEPDPDVAGVALRSRRLDRVLGDPRFRLLLTDPPGEFRRGLDTAILAAVAAGGWEFHALPAYSRLYAGEIADLKQWIVRAVKAHRVNISTTELWAGPWVENVIANLDHIVHRPFVDQWFGVWQGQPVILVAAGPSVTPNLPLLRDLKGKTPIVAAGSGLGPLVEFGIEPDLVVSIDSGPNNYRHFEGRQLRSPLVFTPELYPRIVKEHHGPLIPMASAGGICFGYVCHLAGVAPARIAMGPSVANITLALLQALGAGPVILVGQDLAYPDGRSHADGVPTAKVIDPDRRDTLLWVESVRGEQVPTSTVLQAMLHWTERYLGANPDLQVINTSTVGARIRGTQELTLAEAVARYGLDRSGGAVDAFRGPPPASHRRGPLAITLDADDLRRRIADDAASTRSLVDAAAGAGDRLLTLLRGGSRRASRLRSALLELERRQRRLEETVTYRSYLQGVLHYRRLVLAQSVGDLETWLPRYLDACSLMRSALDALEEAAAGVPLGRD